MRVFKIILLSLMTAGMGRVANAQLGIYGTFTSGKLDVVNVPWLYGGTVGVYHDHGYGPIAAGFDARGEFLRRSPNSGNQDMVLDSGLVGLRVAVTPHVLPLKPYAEGLIGVGHVNVGQGVARTSSTKVEYKVLGGVDFTIFPRLDWRVVEFGYGGLNASFLDIHPKTLSSGLVLRLPL